MRRLIPLALLLLAACQTTRYIGDESSPYYAPPAGTRIVLHRELTIAPDQVGVYFQNGQLLAARDINTYYPHCKFESRRRLDVPQIVKPDEFLVTRVTRNLQPSVTAGTTLYAGVSFGVGIGIGIGGAGGIDGPSVQTFATRMDLHSDRQPDVFRLTCGQWGHPNDGQHVSIDQMREALGQALSLEVPPPAR